MKTCKKCGSETNGFYTEKHKTCKKCQSARLFIAQTKRANEAGFKNYYQMIKFKKFEQILTRKTA